MEKLNELLNIANCLRNGVDPTSKSLFPDDTIMNLPQIRDYNNTVYEILSSLILSYDSKKNRKLKKIPFFMTDSEKEGFMYSVEPLSISKLCFKMNENIPKGMSKISAIQLAEGLARLGYLQIKKNIDGKNNKIPTNKGKLLGIHGVKRFNAYGNEYSVNLYDIRAQHFIVNNYTTIIKAYELKKD